MNNNEVVIEIRGLTHSFQDGTTGVEDVNISIHKGEFVILAGPNGSGKTTLLRHLNGLVMPTEGHVSINGFQVRKNLLRARRMVGMVFQDADSQIVGETVREDVAFGPENMVIDSAAVNERTDWALKKVGLSHKADVAPHLLSGGEKRRLAIGGVLSMEPEIIVFDEPFSNLDYPGICQVVRQMRSLKNEGHTIIVTSHDMDPVMGLADRMVILDRGRVVRDGSPELTDREAVLFGLRPVEANNRGRDDVWPL